MGLQDWWLTTFSEADREWMADTYSPLGIAISNDGATVHNRHRPLVEGNGASTARRASHHLGLLATWFSKPGHEHCAIAFARKSMELISDADPVLDRHFAYANHCIVFYRWRDTVPGALEAAIKACKSCIAIHEQAAAEARAFYGTVPAHACFRQLRIIEEKRGNFDRAVQLCMQAKAGGWADDWDHHIARLQKKATKAAAREQRT